MKRDYPPRPIVSVGAIVIDNNRALIVRRGTELLKGAWSVPGGAVELGETLRQAVAREAREETGLIVEPGAVVNVSDGIYRDARGHIQYHYVFIDFR
jgi:8-oxo-dGTP diphosphatase